MPRSLTLATLLFVCAAATAFAQFETAALVGTVTDGSGGVVSDALITATNVDTVFLLVPLVGIFTLGVTSGFPIYLPELFPTAVRTTGVGFCYNLGRFVTAGGVFLTGYLYGAMGSYAKAATAVSLVYVVGMLVLLFARETRGQSLT